MQSVQWDHPSSCDLERLTYTVMLGTCYHEPDSLSQAITLQDRDDVQWYAKYINFIMRNTRFL